jgi:hypothetical protein
LRELVALLCQEFEFCLLFGDASRYQLLVRSAAAACSTNSRRFSLTAAMRSSISAMVSSMSGISKTVDLCSFGPVGAVRDRIPALLSATIFVLMPERVQHAKNE